MQNSGKIFYSLPKKISGLPLTLIIKRFLIIFLPSSILIGAIIIGFHNIHTNSEMKILETNQMHHVDHQIKMIVNDLTSSITDLMYLSEQNELLKILEGDRARHWDGLSKEYLKFCKNKGIYDQIRFLDLSGREMVRVNFNNDNPYIVPQRQLQSKLHRYYFIESLKLRRKEVYISRFDLNMEKGEIENPIKPVIRIITPVFDRSGKKQGMVVLNYLGRKLLQNLTMSPANSPSQLMWLNSDGFWLVRAKTPEDEWGFMYQNKINRKFSKDFPKAWEKISKTESGQFINDNGMFTFVTLSSLNKINEKIILDAAGFGPGVNWYWKIVSYIPLKTLNGLTNQFEFISLLVILFMPLALGSWNLARSNINRKLMDNLLRESEQRMRFTLEGTDLDLWNWDMISGEITFGDNWHRVLGYVPDEKKFDFKWWSESIHPDSETIFQKALSDYLEGRKKYYELEYQIKNKSGQWLWIWTRGIVQSYDKERKPIKMIGTHQDISERKQAEQNLTHLNKELADKNKELEQIVYITSHDLKSPLVNIQGFTKILQESITKINSVMLGENVASEIKEELDKTLKEDLPEAIKFILLSVSKMNSLLSGLVRLSRLGLLKLDKRKLNMSKLINSMIKEFEFQIKDKDITLQIERLPSCWGDKLQINQLFSNLLTNALKYLEPKRKGIVKISGKKDNKHSIYCIEDNGIGISKNHQPMIFNLFHRIRPKIHEGDGIGLNIVQKILNRHSGKIWLESEPGKGSRFYVSLPRDKG